MRPLVVTIVSLLLLHQRGLQPWWVIVKLVEVDVQMVVKVRMVKMTIVQMDYNMDDNNNGNNLIYRKDMW